MIKILDISQQISSKLDSLKHSQIEDYRIIVRLNLELDVLVITTDEKVITTLRNEFSKYKVTFKQILKEDFEEHAYLKNTFQGSENINLGLKYRFNSLLSKSPNSLFKVQKKHTTPIVTFYSYKGGMGRTTTLTSYALDLAINHNKKVCIIDCDFEAPGYLNFFNLGNNEILKSGTKNGIVEYLTDYNFQNDIDINDYVITLAESHQKELKNLFIVPAGNLSETSIGNNDKNHTTHREHYLEGLSRIDLANETNIIKGFESLFEKINTTIKPDIILIDSRTGFNDIFGVTALILSDLIVGFFGSSEQTKPGLRFMLDRFYDLKIKFERKTELVLINSILPDNEKMSNDFHSAFINEVGKYIEFIQEKKLDKAITEQPQLPAFYKLTRNNILEKVGIKGDEDDEQDYIDHIKIIKEKSFADYSVIFNALNECDSVNKIFEKIIVPNHVKTIELKNTILRRLKLLLRNSDGKPRLFAEDAEIKPETFFYREQMNELFQREKFIIQGFKGTGKTYLYKALVNPQLGEVKQELLERSEIKIDSDYRFIDIISLKGKGENKSFDFTRIKTSEIKEKRYYFTNFWIVYTWNSILLDAKSKLNYNVESDLQSYVKAINPDTDTKKRFEELINSEDKIVIIEKELKLLDEYLVTHKINLVVLYDQLDNLIEPNEWGDSVSPLIDYWWNNLNRFKNISPKIFIRTDLYRRLKGTNTSRLESNKIKIEWSREEVYSFFFKLIFSHQDSYNALFEIMQRSKRYDDTFVNNTKKYLAKNQNQLNLFREEIEPFMTVFFGKEVRSNIGSLGNTFDWFYFNLTNADQKSISLRPFINLVDGSIDNALQDPEKHITQILDQKYYANRENRDNAVKQHFDDLVREDFNKDLLIIFNYLKEKGDYYKQIFLYKTELYELLEKIFSENEKLLDSKSVEELKEILVSNGIVHENVKPDENIFYFAQLYKYWLGLQSRQWTYKQPYKKSQFRK
jgi:cellulose biosynthesis protein BcsQ